MQMGTLANSRDCFNPQTNMTFLQKQGRDAYLPAKWYCEIGDTHSKTVVLAYGDSHARAMIPTLDKYGKATNTKIVFSSIGSCLPLTGVMVSTDYPNACREMGEKMIQLASEGEAKSRRIDRSLDGLSRCRKDSRRTLHHRRPGIAHRIERNSWPLPEAWNSRRANGGQPAPTHVGPYGKHSIYGQDPSDLRLNANAVTRHAYEQQDARENAILKSVASQYQTASVLEIGDALCNSKICPWAMQNSFSTTTRVTLATRERYSVYPLFAEHMDALLGRGT